MEGDSGKQQTPKWAERTHTHAHNATQKQVLWIAARLCTSNAVFRRSVSERPADSQVVFKWLSGVWRVFLSSSERSILKRFVRCVYRCFDEIPNSYSLEGDFRSITHPERTKYRQLFWIAIAFRSEFFRFGLNVNVSVHRNHSSTSVLWGTSIRWTASRW